MKFELVLSRVKKHRKNPGEPNTEGNNPVEVDIPMPLSEEMIGMTTSTAVVAVGAVFAVGMFCGYSVGFKMGKTMGQAIGMSAAYVSLAKMFTRI